jgi:hypothetical protein
MRRWHADRERMLRRWRLEIALHGGHDGWRPSGFRGVGEYAPLPPVYDRCDGKVCHCFRGMGYFRKRHPLDCGKRCFLCHGSKLLGYSKYGEVRSNERRRVIREEVELFEQSGT